MTQAAQQDIFWVEKSRKDDDFYSKYAVDNVMGKGVTSTVYRCKNKLTHDECAAKVIQKMGQGKRKKVISSEVEALLKLDHPNIVKMLDIFESPTEVFIVLELAAGGELFDRIVKKGHYSEKEAARVCYQVISALEYSHRQGIAHRDIKPENILYSSESDDSPIKISDFGFAKSVDNGIMQTFCGTIGYCAPEVVLKKPYTPAVDLWSLGVVLYILLCGYEPFWDEAGEVGVTRKIVYGEYEFESPYWDDISQPAKEFVSEMMKVDPEKRPTAREALNNEWVQGHVANDIHLKRTQDRIREFNAKRKFKAATHAVVAFHKVTSGFSQPQSLSPENGMPMSSMSGYASPGSAFTGASGRATNGMRGGAGSNGMNLPDGYANVRGELMDITNKIVQRVTGSGTNYFSYSNQMGAAVFKRREMESGRRFVVFQDLNYPPGDGHYIVLRKMPGVSIPGAGGGTMMQSLYEAFQLSLGDSIHGYVTNFNGQSYQASTGGNTLANKLGMPQGRGQQGFGLGVVGRKKRKSGHYKPSHTHHHHKHRESRHKKNQ